MVSEGGGEEGTDGFSSVSSVVMVSEGGDEEGTDGFSSVLDGAGVVGVGAQAPSNRDNISTAPTNIQGL